MKIFPIAKVFVNFTLIFNAWWATWYIVIGEFAAHDDLASVETTGTAVPFKYTNAGATESDIDRTDHEDQTTHAASEVDDRKSLASKQSEVVALVALPVSNNDRALSTENQPTASPVNGESGSKETENAAIDSPHNETFTRILATPSGVEPGMTFALPGGAMSEETHYKTFGNSLRSSSDENVTNLEPSSEKVQGTIQEVPSSAEESTTAVLPGGTMTNAPHYEKNDTDLRSSDAEPGTIFNRTKRNTNSESVTDKVVTGLIDGKENTLMVTPSNGEQTTGNVSLDGTVEAQATETSAIVSSTATHGTNESSTAVAPTRKPVGEVSKPHVGVESTTAIRETTTSTLSKDSNDKVVTEVWPTQNASSHYSFEHHSSTSALLLPFTFTALTIKESTSTPNGEFTSQITDDFNNTNIVTQSTFGGAYYAVETTVEYNVSNSSSPGSSTPFHASEKPQLKCEPPGVLNVLEMNGVLVLSWNQLCSSDGCNDFHVHLNGTLEVVNFICDKCPVSLERVNCSLEVNSSVTPGDLLEITVFVGNESDNISRSDSYTRPPAAPQELTVAFTDDLLCLTWTQNGFYDHFQADLSLSSNDSHRRRYDSSATGNPTTRGDRVVWCLDFGFGFCPASEHRVHLRAIRHEKWSDISNVSFYSAPTSPLVKCYGPTNSSFLLEMERNHWENCSDVNDTSRSNPTFQFSVDGMAYNSSILPENLSAMTNVSVGVSGSTYRVEVWTYVTGVLSEGNVVNCTTVPNAPSGVEISGVTTTSASLNWSRPSGLIHEFVYHCRRNDMTHDGITVYTNRTQHQSGVCTNLTPGEIYSVTVSSHLEQEKNISSADSNAVLFVTEPLPPEKVAFLNSTNCSAELSIGCDSRGLSTGFHVAYDVNRAYVCSVEKNLPCRLSGLVSNRWYKVSVYTVSGGVGEVRIRMSSRSKDVGFWTLPDKVSSMNLSSPDSTSLEVVWDPLSLGSSSGNPLEIHGRIEYCIEIRNSSGSTIWTKKCSNETSHLFSHLTSGTNYTISLRAVNEGGAGEALEADAATPAVRPADDFTKLVIVASAVAAVLLLAVVLISIVFLRRRPKFAVPSSKRPSDLLGFRNPAFSPALESNDVCERMKPDPIPFDKFVSHIEEFHNDSEFLFSSEYALMQEMSPKFSQTAAELEDNRIKNRYSNILPFDHSRVRLSPLDEDEDDQCSDYINANYMPGFSSKREFIAAQGPMKSTVDEFWRMIWEQNITTIVMVTNLQERGREKCAEYWPMEDQPIFYGDLEVQMNSESQLNYYIIRVLEAKLGEKKRIIKQLHFVAWPDFGCPENTAILLDFVTGVRSHMSGPSSQNSVSGPILVHCSAGVGRTGTFILVDRLLQHIRSLSAIDIFGIVLEMRNYRCNMIQTESQYIFAFECIKTAIERQMESNCIEEVEDDDDCVYQNVTTRGVGVPREESLYQNVNQTVVEMKTADV